MKNSKNIIIFFACEIFKYLIEFERRVNLEIRWKRSEKCAKAIMNEKKKDKSEADQDQNQSEDPIQGKLDKDRVILPLNDPSRVLYNQSYYGRVVLDEFLELEINEALMLLERQKIEVINKDGTKLTAEEILSKVYPQNEDIWNEYLVYRDLRRRGYIVRGGYGHGIDFRLYPRGANRNEDVAKYFVVILAEGEPVYLQLFDKITEESIIARKQLLLAIVDRLGDVTYYKLEQLQFKNNKLRQNIDL